MSRISGNVKGRRRPSGKRISAASQNLRDTGQLMASIPHGLKIDSTGMHLYGVKNYAAAQQTLRPFMFFETPKDINELRNIVMKRLSQRSRHGQ